MFEQELFRVKAGIADGLAGLKILKNFVVQSQQYEYAAKLNDIKKHLESAGKELSFYGHPELNKGLTPNGKLFHNQLFNYCIAVNWKNLPEDFVELFQERKQRLNGEIKFDDGSLASLIGLNGQLAIGESNVREFASYIGVATNLQGLNSSGDRQTDRMTIKCFTNSKYYEFLHGGFNHSKPFYEHELFVNDFIDRIPAFYYGGQPAPEIQTLPIKFSAEKICLLFSMLANDGLLAWEDFLNIDRIEIDVDVKYRFSRNN